VLFYFNITLATQNNVNDGNTAAFVSGVAPDGATNSFPSTDVDGAGFVSTNATTQYVSDSNVVAGTVNKYVSVDRTIFDSSSDNIYQDIRTFLAKPYLHINSTFTTTDTYSTHNAARFFSPASFFVNSATLHDDKTRGFLGFRATVVARLVVNANRFQQGRYILAYVPLGGVFNDDSPTSTCARWIEDHLSTLVQRTTVPHVEIDLCCDTEAILRIPFNSALNYFPMDGGTGGSEGLWGMFKLYPYSPLSAVSGNTTCGYSLYFHMEDVEMVNACIPQSSRNVFSSVKSKNATEVEQDSANIGPLTSSLIRVRDASSILAKVPLLSSYASTVSWFADIGASAAKVFGWSKPVVLAPSTRVTQNYLAYAANVDGPDMSFPISLSYENSVGMANGFSGTDIDELSFSFLNTIPAWFKTISWTTANASGASLSILDVSPLGDPVTTIVNAATFNHFSPMQLVQTHFAQWRGSLVFKFKFVKTEFHSGRLMFVFNPYPEHEGPEVVTLVNSIYAHRQIVDIRETNEFTFIVPYISEFSYKLQNLATGNLTILVLDPLVAPATVSQNVTILMEKCGGPDLEFAVPTASNYSYYTGITPQSGGAFSSSGAAVNVCNNFDGTVGSSLIKYDGSLNSLFSVGEKITSVRTLLKLPNLLAPFVGQTPTNFLNVAPFSISSGTVVGVTNTAPSILNDAYSRFASCFVYSRGGIRLKYVDSVAVTATQTFVVTLFSQNGVAALDTNVVAYTATYPTTNSFESVTVGLPSIYYRSGFPGEVQVPQYGRLHSRPNVEAVVNASSALGLPHKLTIPRVFVSKHSLPGGVITSAILRSISDDGNMGGFVSVPPMFFIQA
jgi:hypothetical protein